MKYSKCFAIALIALFITFNAEAQINTDSLKLPQIQSNTLKTALIPFLKKLYSDFRKNGMNI